MTIRVTMPAQIANPSDSWPVTVTLIYTLDDPWAVRADIVDDCGQRVAWVFARELLAEGARHNCGIGEVRVWPAPSGVIVVLDNAKGYAQLALPTSVVRGFLRRIYAAVPAGDEHLCIESMDDEIAKLLDEAAS